MEQPDILATTEHLTLERSIFRSPLRPHGRPWLVVRRKPAVVIVPRRADGLFLLIKQERPPVQRLLLEFPAGQLEGSTAPSPSALQQTALRELEEETAHTTSHPLQPIGAYFSSPGFTNEHETIFLAKNIQPRQNISSLGETTEAIAGLEWLSPHQLAEAIRTGQIVDANSITAYTFLHLGGHL
jgi:ADP-ribose pyrophosphatase